MNRALRWLGRTLLWVAAGTVLMILITQGYALTQSTCSTICNPRVSGPLGALTGLIVSLMLPTLRWKPLETDE